MLLDILVKFMDLKFLVQCYRLYFQPVVIPTFLTVLARSRAYGPVLSVRLSVRRHDNSLQTQPIDLKLSTHLNKLKSGAKFEDGQNRNKFISCHGYLIETKVGLWGKK